MNKKYILIIIPTVIILILVFIVLINKNNRIEKTITAVPTGACIIIETEELSKITKKFPYQNKIWKELIKLDHFNKIHKQIVFIDSLFNRDKNDFFRFDGHPIIMSFHLMGKNSIENLFLFNSINKFSAKDLHDKLNILYPAKFTSTERKYENNKIYQLNYSNDSKEYSIFMSSAKGIIIFSFTPILIENSLRQLNTNTSLINEYGFKKVALTAGSGVDGNMYINMNLLPKLLSVNLNEDYQDKLFSMPQIANWSELDIKITDEALLFYGYTYSNDSSSNYLNIYKSQSPQKLESYQILPANTGMFICLGFNDFSSFYSELQKYHKSQESLQGLSTHINYINNKYDTDLRKLYSSFLENEACLAVTNESSLSEEENHFVILKSKSKSLAKEQILDLQKNIAKTHGKSVSEYKLKIKIDSETTYNVYRLPLESLYKCLFGKIFGKNHYQYITFIDNYLIAGNSKKALAKFIHYHILNKTLTTNETFVQTTEHLSNRSNFYFYCNLPNSKSLSKKYLTNSIAEDIRKVEKIQSFGYQFYSDKDLIINNLVLQHHEQVEKKPHTMWETLLDTVTNSKPVFVLNHYTSENEIFIQDLRNNIYLINQAGRILWKVKLDEKIKSNIYQIDYYKNKKLQLLFSTENMIYLLDRNGNNVEKYPIKLRAPATNGISLFDYEKNKDYRILVACNNKKVYTYNKEGIIVKGWEFDKTENVVRSDIQHFKVNDKDYIIFADKYKIYILNRKGETRVNVKENIIKSNNNKFILEKESTNTKARLVTTDTLGNVVFIYLDGKIENSNFKVYSGSHYFDYQDINGDLKKEFIFLDKNELNVYSSQKKELFNYTFNSENCLQPIYFHFSKTNRKIGVVDYENKELYLINNNGKLYKGFPLKGQTLFSIGKFSNSNGKFNLIVGNDDKFLYNYTVQ